MVNLTESSYMENKPLTKKKISTDKNLDQFAQEYSRLFHEIHSRYDEIDAKRRQIEEAKRRLPVLPDYSGELRSLEATKKVLCETCARMIDLELTVPKVYTQLLEDKLNLYKCVNKECSASPLQAYADFYKEMKLNKLPKKSDPNRPHLVDNFPLPDLRDRVSKSKSGRHARYRILVEGNLFVTEKGMVRCMPRQIESAEDDAFRGGSQSSATVVLGTDGETLHGDVDVCQLDEWSNTARLTGYSLRDQPDISIDELSSNNLSERDISVDEQFNVRPKRPDIRLVANESYPLKSTPRILTARESSRVCPNDVRHRQLGRLLRRPQMERPKANLDEDQSRSAEHAKKGMNSTELHGAKRKSKHITRMVDNHHFDRQPVPTTSSISRIPQVLPDIQSGSLVCRNRSPVTRRR